MLGLENLLDRKPAALSGGQRQRVALGRAIVRQPKAFLFDEPLSNLDTRLRVQTRTELKRLHRRLATTTTYVTHDQEEATIPEGVPMMAHVEAKQQFAPHQEFDAQLDPSGVYLFEPGEHGANLTRLVAEVSPT